MNPKFNVNPVRQAAGGHQHKTDGKSEVFGSYEEIEWAPQMEQTTQKTDKAIMRMKAFVSNDGLENSRKIWKEWSAETGQSEFRFQSCAACTHAHFYVQQ